MKETLKEEGLLSSYDPIFVEELFPVAEGFLRVMETQNIPFGLGHKILGDRLWKKGVIKGQDKEGCQYVALCTLISFLGVKKDTPEDTPFYKKMRDEIIKGEDIPQVLPF